MTRRLRKERELVVLERDIPEGQILPKDFFDIIINRYLPVLSFTYISSIIGIALKKGSLMAILSNGGIYDLALCISVWVSVPAVIWILVKEMPSYSRYADAWYKITAGVMVSLLLFSYEFFPMSGGGFMGAVRVFIVAALPIHFVMYFFFVKGGMSLKYSVPLASVALTFFLYGHFLI